MNVIGRFLILYAFYPKAWETVAFLTQNPEKVGSFIPSFVYNDRYFSDIVSPTPINTYENTLGENYGRSSRVRDRYIESPRIEDGYGRLSRVEDGYGDTRALEARLSALQEAKRTALEAERALQARLAALEDVKREASVAQSGLEDRLAVFEPTRRYGYEQPTSVHDQRHQISTWQQQAGKMTVYGDTPHNSWHGNNGIQRERMRGNGNPWGGNDRYPNQSYNRNQRQIYQGDYDRQSYNQRSMYQGNNGRDRYGQRQMNSRDNYNRSNGGYFNGHQDYNRDYYDPQNSGHFNDHQSYRHSYNNHRNRNQQPNSFQYNDNMRVKMNGEW